jgi:Cysteine-rich CPCC
MVKTGLEYFNAIDGATSPRKAEQGAFRCPCCDDISFDEIGSYQICSCGWEDDPVQELHPDLAIGANGISLNEGRTNFKKFGDCKGAQRPTVLPLP